MRHLAAFPLLALLGIATPARAELAYAIHLEGAAARMVGPGKADQFGWGGGGLVAPELTFGSHLGLELAIGGLALSDGAVDEIGLAPTAGGYGLFALPGLRLRPFGRPENDAGFDAGGLWLSGGGGLAYTGDLARPAFDARVGYDLYAGASFRGGPALGFLQILETESTVRPEDARVILLGLHGAFEPTHTVRRDVDGDGYPDDDDGCPDDPEDFDAFEDADGCPDLDNDRDDVRDRDDACPDDPEDADDFEDEDGCPDLDNDRDRLLDRSDRCPNEAEDRDGFDDGDGCPDLDNDEDGFLDAQDGCPDEPETLNDYADDDGCPDAVEVRVVGDEILLDDRIHFAINNADVLPRSWPLLIRLADLLVANPSYTLVRIQGHADDTGDEAYNQDLSERRARAVRALLVAHGVDPERLVAEGFGELRPRDEASTFSARNQNRRVEFLILERRRVVLQGEVR